MAAARKSAVSLLLPTAYSLLPKSQFIEPTERLTVAAKRLAAGDYDAQLSYGGRDEVGVLTDTFSTMRDRLKANISALSDKAFTDDLTGVKSKHAYVEAEDRLDRRIETRAVEGFAMVLFDLNDLKTINDTQGHEAGDRYIREACRIICTRFKHSPVYRIGGDEFVAILEGDDFDNRDALLSAFERQMDDALSQGRITVASGHACYDPALDKRCQTVFERADEAMYRRKKQMKGKVTGGRVNA